MFYCDPCAIKTGWPQTLMSSYGACELCKTVAVCNDVPSKYLPPAKQESE